jgi:hypothetical protein
MRPRHFTRHRDRSTAAYGPSSKNGAQALDQLSPAPPDPPVQLALMADERVLHDVLGVTARVAGAAFRL